LRAVREMGVKSPLAEAGLTQQEVRSLAEKLGISVANRPAAPCLATRLPYGADLQTDILRKIEAGETYLKQTGFPVVRLRLHENIARIEIPVSDFSSFIEKRQEITERLKQTGFSYITLDMEGFRSGSMDETLPEAGTEK
ncbi:MAG: TIGR00268 family protein, partial [Blautia coccoides]